MTRLASGPAASSSFRPWVLGGFDDNVYATNDNEDDDFFAMIRPDVQARSD